MEGVVGYGIKVYMLCRLGVLIMYNNVCDKGTFVDVHVV